MFALKRLFGSQDDFLALLIAMAGQGKISSASLAEMFGAQAAHGLTGLRESRVRERELATKVETLLCETNTVPFGRDDFNALAKSVQAVPRAIRKFGERYNICAKHIGDADFRREVALLESAADTVHTLVSELQSGLKVGKAKEHNDKLQKVEGQVDDFVLDTIVRLYHETENPIRAVMLKDLYELLDRAFDRCRSCGNLIMRVVMKHS